MGILTFLITMAIILTIVCLIGAVFLRIAAKIVDNLDVPFGEACATILIAILVGWAVGMSERYRRAEQNYGMNKKGKSQSTHEEDSRFHFFPSSTSTINDTSSAPASLHRSIISTTFPKATRRSALMVSSALNCSR